MAPSMLFVRNKAGKITAETNDVDETTIEAWGKVYQGNETNHTNLVRNFIREYQSKIFVRDQQYNVPEFTKEMILEDCQTASHTAPGWDQWTGQDWTCLSDRAAERLAQLLNAIENGLPWPEPMKWGKAHFLAKTEEASLDPLDYRILLVLQRLYRRWATMRLRHMQAWVQEWQMDEMFAGVKNGGADMAWMSTALDNEIAIAEATEYILGLLDIWKCFDQIVPLLIQVLAGLAGMPTKVLWPYARLMGDIQVANALPLGVGRPYSRPCSIPQGCPFSMTLLALLLRPWLLVIKTYNHVIPRTLADDLSLWAKRQSYPQQRFLQALQQPPKAQTHLDQPIEETTDQLWWEEWARAVEATLHYLRRIGAKAAHSKSLLLTNCRTTRKLLRNTKWEAGQHCMPVVLKARDLGAFLNTTQQKLGGTTVSRMTEALIDIRNIERLPRPKPVLARMIATKALAKAFYGSETTQPRKKDLTTLASACASAVMGKTNAASPRARHCPHFRGQN